MQDFIVTELKMALTFGHLANSSDNPEKAERNARNAQQAHDAAIRFLDITELSPAENREIQERVTSVERVLEEFRKKA